jgi:hypothetical protein
MVLPYWTTPHGNLSLRVRNASPAAPTRGAVARLPAPVKGGPEAGPPPDTHSASSPIGKACP